MPRQRTIHGIDPTAPGGIEALLAHHRLTSGGRRHGSWRRQAVRQRLNSSPHGRSSRASRGGHPRQWFLRGSIVHEGRPVVWDD
jgi:hypothetical protein